MAKLAPRLGKVQIQIMQVLWDRGEATAREITDELSRSKAIAHSTVQTLLRKLEVKGTVTHRSVERTFVFRALHCRDEIIESATGDLLSRLFQGSVYGLVAHLIRHERISREELERLRKLIGEESAK